MAIPSGGGSEILKGVSFDQSAAATVDCITATTHQICSLLSVTLTATGGANNVSLLIGTRYFLYNQAIPSSGTFIWNDKVVWQAGDIFKIRLHTATQVISYVSYIVQDWS